MDKLSLKAEEREILGKKVKRLRQDGFLPGHVFGKGLQSEAVAVSRKDFLKIFHLAGETGLINLTIGEEKIKPVLIREVQYDPIKGVPIHIDFYQVNLSQKVKVAVPLSLVGEEIESVKLGEAILLQTLNEVEVEALPADLVEKIEVDTSKLKNIDDAITVSELNYDRTKLTLHADPEATVVKLAPAVTAQMEKLLEEEAAETAEAAAEAVGEEGAEAVTEEEGETGAEPEAGAEGGGQSAEAREEEKEKQPG